MTSPVAFCCNDCGQDRYGSHVGVSTWHTDRCGICGETKAVTEPRDFGRTFHTTASADSSVVTSCPECGTVTDIEYGTVKDTPPDCKASLAALMAEGYREMADDSLATAEAADSFSVPFKTQEWMFESLAEYELDKLHDLIDDNHDRILEMARDRFRDGYAEHGSQMYSWTPKRRLSETLQELADAVVYPTSGPLE